MRYFLAFNSATLKDDISNAESLEADQLSTIEEGMSNSSLMAENNNTSSSRTNTQSKVQNIMQTIRSSKHVIANKRPQYPQEDYVQLPSDMGDQDDYVFDTTGSQHSIIVEDVAESFACPPTLEEMMSIVRNLRVQRKNAIQEFEFQDPIIRNALSRGPNISTTTTSSTTNGSNNRPNTNSQSKLRQNKYDKVFA